LRQVDSFIPLWEWNVTKKKDKKSKDKKDGSSKKDKGKQKATNGGEAVVDSDSKPGVNRPRSAFIEEVEDDE